MAAIILGDLHAGEKSGNTVMMNHQLDYLDSVIEYALENDISTIIQSGDIFDVRMATNTRVLHEWKQRFFNKLYCHGIELVLIIGNHDMFYRNKISPNTPTELLSEYNNIRIFDKPTVTKIKDLGDLEFLMVPWICSENEEECLDAINNVTADVCFGHFEVKGARMESGVCTEGLPLSTFKRFNKCISGHFHSAGLYENVQYVGTPYQMTWGDYGVEKGFWIINDSGELIFIENMNDLFIKIIYNEDHDMESQLKLNLENKYVKVVIEKRDDFKLYEKWFNKLQEMGMDELKVIEPFSDRSQSDVDVEFDGELTIKSTEDIITDYITDLYPERKERLGQIMLGVHAEARKQS